MKHATAPFITFISGVILSIILSFFVRDWKQAEHQFAFEQHAQSRLALFQVDVHRHEEVVNAMVRLFKASEEVSREEFRIYTEDALSNHHSILGLSWNPRVMKNEREELTQSIRDEGFADFEFTELNSNRELMKAPQREDYVIAKYIEPLSKNREAFGYNIASDEKLKKAIVLAVDSGKPIITEPIQLVQGNRKGYLLLSPAYKKNKPINTVAERRENFIGLAVGVFQFEHWMEHALETISPIGIDIWFSENKSEAEFFHFFSSRTRTESFKPTKESFLLKKKGMHWQKVQDVVGKQWTFVFTPTEDYLEQLSYWESWIVLLIGLLVTLLLFKYISSNVRHVNDLKISERVLTIARNEANAANEFKSQFLSRMSHELRTPMNAVLGFAQMLDINSDNLTGIQKDNVKEILSAGQHQMDLINELLDLSQIESGKMEVTLEDIVLDDVVQECVSLVTPQLNLNKITFINLVNDKYIVKADFIRIKQVLLNLLSNAVKYNSKEGKVTLEANVSENGLLRISVTDTGEGLSEEEIDKLFISFNRMNKVKNIDGTGIGLVITKYLVEMMGGNVGVESEPGKGSTFWIEIRLSEPS